MSASAIPDSVLLDPRLRKAPLVEVLRGARGGSIMHLIELRQRTVDSPEIYSLDILSSFLVNLKVPDAGGELGFERRMRGRIALVGVQDAVVACGQRPSLVSNTAKQVVGALQDIITWTHLILRVARDEWTENSLYEIQDPGDYETSCTILMGIASLDDSVLKALTCNRSLVDLFVMWWLQPWMDSSLVWLGKASGWT
ncbi:hypothetical protein NMY22_g14364 [Coprinellus aureogranulatus]|nr:hypothetical protein NMY22_g14364 [Coprinellus aureogranulatus]